MKYRITFTNPRRTHSFVVDFRTALDEENEVRRERKARGIIEQNMPQYAQWAQEWVWECLPEAHPMGGWSSFPAQLTFVQRQGTPHEWVSTLRMEEAED